MYSQNSEKGNTGPPSTASTSTASSGSMYSVNTVNTDSSGSSVSLNAAHKEFQNSGRGTLSQPQQEPVNHHPSATTSGPSQPSSHNRIPWTGKILQVYKPPPPLPPPPPPSLRSDSAVSVHPTPGPQHPANPTPVPQGPAKSGLGRSLSTKLFGSKPASAHPTPGPQGPANSGPKFSSAAGIVSRISKLVGRSGSVKSTGAEHQPPASQDSHHPTPGPQSPPKSGLSRATSMVTKPVTKLGGLGRSMSARVRGK